MKHPLHHLVAVIQRLFPVVIHLPGIRPNILYSCESESCGPALLAKGYSLAASRSLRVGKALLIDATA